MENEVSILSGCTAGGCGAKISPGELSFILETIPKTSSPNLLVGYDASDDAAVYKIDDENSIISTVDFFSPMVEDPLIFGRIAAANALSDIYAMGGIPHLALNLVCFPENFPVTILKEILKGGAEKIAEAGAALGGGHSIYDKEIKYGLAVTGVAKTKQIIRNNTPQSGHMLILTKPLGTGIIMAASRAGEADSTAMEKALASMQKLNRFSAEKMARYDVSACTDITGFGLLVHLLEMCGNKGSLNDHNPVSAVLDIDQIPLFPEALGYAKEYLLTAAGQRNRNNCGRQADLGSIPPAMQEILFDPQTSGGLLICVNAAEAEILLEEIHKNDPDAKIIGRIVPRLEKAIVFN